MACATETSGKGKKAVRFGDLTIREYPIELGDHPCCSEGAPIQIGWEPQDCITRNLNLYEFIREGERRHGRKQLTIPVLVRAQLLLQAGHSLDELGQATMEVDEVKRLRNNTLATMKSQEKWDRFQTMMENTVAIPKDFLESTSQRIKKALEAKPVKHPKPVQHTANAHAA